jgi:hypothetical protein
MVGEGYKLAVNANVGIVADLEMKVAGFALSCYAQQVIDAHRTTLQNAKVT